MKKNALNELLPKKVVLVIGNGFDLDMGLRTSYADFVDSIYFKYLIDPNQKNPVEMMEGVDEDKIIRIPNGMASYVMEEKEHNNWVDLEECIVNTAKCKHRVQPKKKDSEGNCSPSGICYITTWQELYITNSKEIRFIRTASPISCLRV